MKVAALFLALIASASAFAPATRMARSQTALMAKPASKALKYVDALSTKDLPKPGSATSVDISGIDVCIAVASDGLVYAVGNKAPGTGSPLFGGKVSKNTIKDELYGTEFSLTTGEPVGKWMPGGLGIIIGNFIKPESIPVYKVKKGGNKIQVEVDVNYKLSYESNYWRGILDAQGKTDGGYY